MRIVSDIIGYFSKHMPKYNTVSISDYQIIEAKADSVLQAAFTPADVFGALSLKETLEKAA